MSRNLIRFSLPLISGAAVALVVLGCSSDTTTPGGGTGGSKSDAGTGGKTGSTGGTTGTTGGTTGTTGGTTGTTGGTTGTGGATDVDAGNVYTCLSAPPADPGGTGVKDDACCDTPGLGKVGTCTDPASITDPIQKAAFGHGSCGPTLLCAPKAGLSSSPPPDAGVYAPCKAKALGNLEGRCLPKCFVAGNPQSPNLAQDDCKSPEEVCAPCYSPVPVDGKTGAQPTGACSQAALDAPVDLPPAVFKECGAVDGGPTKGLMGGLCIPRDLALASGNTAAPSLKQDDCSTGEVCTPTLKVNNVKGCFTKCDTGIAGQYAPGACVPSYVVRDVGGNGAVKLFKKGTCTGDDDICAPCANPLTGGSPSHSCE